ncbi:MAG: hypothetical protein JNIBNLAF_01377 [Nitrosomonas europaea]|uniref:chemotaxis protein CheW n=1 Tax=Nitrosomonas TaxID=914 RepID=UPI0023F40638|nr:MULTISPECIES: chemotaxis protein CheW [Nitrosomonas]MBV6389730.1 hypothetical protein [Nitrosomonas europaea]
MTINAMSEHQSSLTEQINKKAQETSATIPVLGITIGDDRWLIPMSNISEILPVPKITPVFLTQPWFLGVINVRGNVYGLCDLSHYLDNTSTCISAKTRVFLTIPRLGVSYAMLAGSVLGIRNLMEFVPQSDHEDKRPVVAGIYKDRQDRLWRMLNLPALLQLESFQRAGS